MYTADRMVNQKTGRPQNSAGGGGSYESYYNSMGTGNNASGMVMTSGPQLIDAYEMDNQNRQDSDEYESMHSDQMMSPPLEPMDHLDS